MSEARLHRASKSDLALPPNCGYCGRRFKPKGLAPHERSCGRGLADRYRIVAVTGRSISPAKAYGAVDITTTYAVCDGHDLWHEIGWFVPGAGYGEEPCRKLAEAFCRELNLEELMAA